MTAISRRVSLALLLYLGFAGWDSARAQSSPDPLPSWNDGPTKKAIVDFVARVTTQGGARLRAGRRAHRRPSTTTARCGPSSRSTSRSLFAFDRVKALAPQHPEWQDTGAVQGGARRRPRRRWPATGEKGLLRDHGGDPRRHDHRGVRQDRHRTGLRRARHPRFGRPYTEMVYQPMLELLAYLRANGFKTFIVSGGGIEFMRPWAEQRLRHPARAGGRLLRRRPSSRCATASRCW